MIAAISGGRADATIALAETGRLLGACSQERATRQRRGGLNASGMPDQALDLLLQKLGRSRRDLRRIVRIADGAGEAPADGSERLDHHFAHACTAYLTSPFSRASIVICDHEEPWLTVWQGEGATISPVEYAPRQANFATVFSRCAALFGFRTAAGDQHLEALARLQPNRRDPEIDALLSLVDGSLVVDPAFAGRVEARLAGEPDPGSLARASLASALQMRLAELFLQQLREIASLVDAPDLCLGGSFFSHSSVNSVVKQSGVFRSVFVPVDPGNAGLAVGAACHAAGLGPFMVSPFLGPSYSPEEIKATLDNCKLQYSWQSEESIVADVVTALLQGRLVGWFDDRMEWGPRALGARSILANPSSPYVLENLNRFLKQREPWRGYAFSGPENAVREFFEGPSSAPFMECDFLPRDSSRFAAALPEEGAAVRVQTIRDGLPRFMRLVEAFGKVTGLPFLINSSFNGFHEPIVCSPRDAVRVFYGTGLDLLVIDQFVLRK